MPKTKKRPPVTAATAEDLMRLARAAAYLYFAMQEAGRHIGAVNEANMGVWGALSSLKTLGPRTVPDLARERPVSRQYMQKVVDALAAEGLVAFLPNPAHKRSNLVGLTQAGEKRFAEINADVRKSFGGIVRGISSGEAKTAMRVLEAMRAGALELVKDAGEA